MSLWAIRKLGHISYDMTMIQRIQSCLKMILSTLFSRKLFPLCGSFIKDVIFQCNVFKSDPVRWLMHFLIFSGFMLLLLFHAMDEIITQTMFSNYASTLNPYQFLRNVFGLMVIIGLLIAAYRRLTCPKIRMISNATDYFAIIILAIIFITGFLLEGSKIISESVFNDMTSQYAFIDDPSEAIPLKVYWAKEFHVAFKNFVVDTSYPSVQAIMAEGYSMHLDSCAACHSIPEWAFISYPMGKLMTPFAEIIDAVRGDIILWYIHFIACFIGLAYLPFSKFFHLVSTPISLMTHAITEKDNQPVQDANQMNRRIMSLDACTHCGTCTLYCSVAPVYQYINNQHILPSEKLMGIRSMIAGHDKDNNQLKSLWEGTYICTLCYKCTQLCPVHINLQDIWFATKEELAEKNLNELGSMVKSQLTIESLLDQKRPDITFKHSETFAKTNYLTLYNQSESFSTCIQCQTCTSVCPIVTSTVKTDESLNYTPQRVMNLLRLGLIDLAIRSDLVWDCTTCYLCQEHCPQHVRVTDILYELKQLSYLRNDKS